MWFRSMMNSRYDEHDHLFPTDDDIQQAIGNHQVEEEMHRRSYSATSRSSSAVSGSNQRSTLNSTTSKGNIMKLYSFFIQYVCVYVFNPMYVCVYQFFRSRDT